MSQLETLLIGGTKVTNQGLTKVKVFRGLKKLSIFGTHVGDDGLSLLIAKAFYTRLKSKGKESKVAIVASMRKLVTVHTHANYIPLNLLLLSGIKNANLELSNRLLGRNVYHGSQYACAICVRK